MTGVRARGLVASKPLSIQRAGGRGAMPVPAYEDLASALHSPAWSNMHARPPARLLDPRGRPPICSQDNEVCELFCLAAGRW